MLGYRSILSPISHRGIKLLMNAAVMSPAVVFLIGIERVSLLYLFVVITTYVLSFFVFRSGPSMSMEISCRGPLGGNRRLCCRLNRTPFA